MVKKKIKVLGLPLFFLGLPFMNSILRKKVGGNLEIKWRANIPSCLIIKPDKKRADTKKYILLANAFNKKVESAHVTAA